MFLKITLIILAAWIFTTIVYILASRYLTWEHGFYYDTPVLTIIAWIWLVEFLAFFGFLITTIVLW